MRSRGTTNFLLDSRLSAAVSPLRGFLELREILTHHGADSFERLFEDQTIHRHDGESRIVGFQNEAMLCRHHCYHAFTLK